VQRKQAWYREYLVSLGASPLPFVGSIKIKEPVARVADRMRREMGLDTGLRSEAANWEEALRMQVTQIESHGVLVLRNGVVASNNRRKLSVSEFRGFALSDAYAPVIFLNNRDATAAQMFTLAHELAHIWVGASGVSNTEQTYANHNDIERFCNQVAAELLVPVAELQTRYASLAHVADPVPALCKHFRVSSLVILRRLRDIQVIDQKTFLQLYRNAEAGFQTKADSKESGGGDFYRTEMVRVSPTFARALVESALEGRTPYRDACDMLGVASVETLKKLAKHFEFIH
jgi:Zn-dependent peptidase ImmA (M78 family)